MNVLDTDLMKCDNNTEIDLPDKASELLRLALSDLEKVESNPNYRVDMCCWHEPHFGHCSVCLAGAVMTRAVKFDQYRVPVNFAEKTADKLQAIDHLRTGNAGMALMLLNQLPKDASIAEMERFDCTIPDYEDDSGMFKHCIGQLADELEKNGL